MIIGGERDREAAGAIRAIAPDRIVDFTGSLPLADLPALLAGARAFVGGDTGPTHLAGLIGAPTVCIFSGVSDARIWRPLGEKVTLIRHLTDCQNCKLTNLADCRHGHICMERISVEEVFNSLRRIAAPVLPPAGSHLAAPSTTLPSG